jgi:hypothetical protein
MSGRSPNWPSPGADSAEIDQWLQNTYDPQQRASKGCTNSDRPLKRRKLNKIHAKDISQVTIDSTTGYLHRLPAELQDMVYDFALNDLSMAFYCLHAKVSSVYGIKGAGKPLKSFPSWFNIDPVVREGATEQFYRRAVFTLELQSAHRHTSPLGMQPVLCNLSKIRRLEITNFAASMRPSLSGGDEETCLVPGPAWPC